MPFLLFIQKIKHSVTLFYQNLVSIPFQKQSQPMIFKKRSLLLFKKKLSVTLFYYNLVGIQSQNQGLVLISNGSKKVIVWVELIWLKL